LGGLFFILPCPSGLKIRWKKRKGGVMKTKYFEARVTKEVKGGMFTVYIQRVVFSGSANAYVFKNSQLRQELFWNEERDEYNTTIYDYSSYRKFKTAAEAARWLEEVRRHLEKLDTIYEERLRELEALSKFDKIVI